MLNSSTSPPRSLLACDRCSRRKQRCDRLLPTCSACQKARTSCARGRKEQQVVNGDSGTPQSKGYVELLENRVARLEAQARERGLSSLMMPAGPSTPSSGPGDNQLHQRSSGLDADIDLLALGAMAEPRNRAEEFLKGLSMPGIVLAITETYGGDPESTSRTDLVWDGIAKDIRKVHGYYPDRLVIPRELALRYVDKYYTTVDFRYPRIPRQSITAGIMAITANDETDYHKMMESDPAKIFMAYMVIAITPLISTNYPISQASFVSTHILSKALQLLNRIFKQEDGVDLIQSLLLLVIFSMHSSAAGSSWHLIGIAMKKCIALGFHRKQSRSNSDFSSEELEQRRWAFWSCYLLDRFINIRIERPFNINDRYIDVEFPGTLLKFVTNDENRNIHLCRYALLTSEIASDRGKHSFAYHLSHMLHWKTYALQIHGFSDSNQNEYLVSLYNSLLLRLIMMQIIYNPSGKGSQEDILQGQIVSNTRLSISASREFGIQSELRRAEELKLRSTCQAVLSSHNRANMRDRHFLSSLTGFDAITAALGLLYWTRISGVNPGIGKESYDVAFSSPLDENTVSGFTDQSVNSLSNDNSDSIECGPSIDVALQVLTRISRQFPAVNKYRNVILQIRNAISSQIPTLPNTTHTNNRVKIHTIGPQHLRKFVTEKFGDLVEQGLEESPSENLFGSGFI